MKTVFVGVAAIAVCGAFAGGMAMAGAPATSEVDRVNAILNGISEKYDEMESKKATGEQLVNFYFWPDAVAAGEGLGRAYQGTKELVEMSNTMAAQAGECRHVDNAPTLLAGNMASQLVQYQCRTPGDEKQVSNFRVLYVWLKRGGAWKVAREMWSSGTLR
jgi:hypothetical protein